MKFLPALVLAFAASAIAIPSDDYSRERPKEPSKAAPEPPAPTCNAAEQGLGARCVRQRKYGGDQVGVCIDTNVCGSCSEGAIYTGLCPGAAAIRCCIVEPEEEKNRGQYRSDEENNRGKYRSD